MKDYDGKVRVVFKNMVVHPQVVTRAHLAGCAAGKQGKFIAYKEAANVDLHVEWNATR